MSCLSYFHYMFLWVCQGRISKTIVDDSNSSKGMKAFEVNTRMTYALRACGLGSTMFTCIMNTPQSMTVVNFDNIWNKIRDSAIFIADLSMNNAANERLFTFCYVGVTVGGTWQRRGYTSMNGVVVGSGKVLNVEPMSIKSSECETNVSILFLLFI